MADQGAGRTFAEIDSEAIEKYNRQLQHNLEREAKLQRQYEWRGNKLPPFSIEPLGNERQRLATAMTAEDRALRKQWLKDQELSHNEPRFVPELYPRNPIRRLLGAPWDAVFRVLRPVLGEHYASSGRFFVPKFTMAIVFGYYVYYQAKYNGNTWADKHGLYIFSTKPKLQPNGEVAPSKAADDFNERGFKGRTVLLDVSKTSTAP